MRQWTNNHGRNPSAEKKLCSGSGRRKIIQHGTARDSDTNMHCQEKFYGESMLEQSRDRIVSGESRNMKNSSECDYADSSNSSDVSKSQVWGKGPETTFNSDVSEKAIHSLSVDWNERGKDREMHQDPDRQRYTTNEESTEVDSAADDLEMIALSTRPTRLLPHATVNRSNLEPLEESNTFEEETVC